MHIFKKIKSVKSYLGKQVWDSRSLGFVPTMGALHAGHLDLVRRAKKENDVAAVSIFVNPIQFNNPDDLRLYPRNLEADMAKLEEAGCDVLFVPEVAEMYPTPVTKKYDFGRLDKVLEGVHRPGHFNGVAVVVHKLLDIFRPGQAYFGEKDYQQLMIIKSLVSSVKLPVRIIGCPTIREPDGLAMSSRNARLQPEARALAPVLYKSLKEVRNDYKSMAVAEAKSRAIRAIESNGILKVEYFEIVDAATLVSIDQWKDAVSVIAILAVWAGDVRLIDNLMII